MSKALRLTPAEYAAILAKRPQYARTVKHAAGALDAKPVRKSKYNAQRTVVDGITFASKKEAKRYAELRLMEKAGEISDLMWQVSFELIPAQDGENNCCFVCDFVYTKRNGEPVHEDTKGLRTPAYIIKRKLMLWRQGIRIKEL